MEEVFELVNEMSPYLLLGFFIAGLMHAFIPKNLYSKYLSGKNIRSVINAALLGVPLPLCSCGVIPTSMSLRREGASKGAVVSFLIATPQTGVDSICATFSLMGLPFAIIRPIAALVTAIFGGALVNAFDKGEEKESCEEAKHEEEHHCCCSHEHHEHKEEEHHCCCGEHHEHEEEHCGCGCGCDEDTEGMTFGQKMISALRFGFVEMMGDIGKWLVVGLVIAAVITLCFPDDWFAVFKDNTLASMLLVLCISIPMYLCATGSIPIAVALMLKGLTPGAALVLLMAGPASNAASILVINKVLGKKSLVLYLISIITGAVLFGIAIDHLMPTEWFTSSLIMQDACCEHGSSWFEWGCTVVLALLLLNVVRMKLMHKETCSCCHDEHDEHCH